ncbi:MAG: hypothetical protein HYW70_00090 [Candidatus Nealsonbacteria bacterium]|nr:hypothetical protein [Candidatus Nealsonbacteria bacterium]
MTNPYFKFALIISAALLLSAASALALVKEEKEKIQCPAAPQPFIDQDTINWDEYRCQDNSCGGKILSRGVSEDRKRKCSPFNAGTDENGCTTYSFQCDEWSYSPSVPSPQREFSTAPPYAACQGGQNWSTTQPSFSCTGSCLVEDKQKPTDPTPKDKEKNINLPTNLLDQDYKNKVGWKNVESWGKEYGPQSYKVTVKNSGYSGVARENQISIPACTFQSNASNNWQVQACCSVDGQSCGDPSNWSFNTTLPPELKEPFDPDWDLGKEEGITPEFPIPFEWCPVPEAESYYIVFNNRGEDKVFSDWPVDRKPDGTLLSKFIEELGGLTKATPYDWQVATCFQKFGNKCGLTCKSGQWGGGCAELSQKWQVISQESKLSIPNLISPQNDAVLNIYDSFQWGGVKGAYSYMLWLKIETSKAIEIPIYFLETNIPMTGYFLTNSDYKWKVKPCWDQLAKNCEDTAWSEERQFRTTGAAPTNLKENPLSNAGTVIVPAKLDWDDMPGAITYRYEVSTSQSFSSREGEFFEGIVEESEAKDIDYPKLKSKTDYWWRVKTCADDGGLVCGKWSAKNFNTIVLDAPTNPSPTNGGKVFTRGTLGWNNIPGANFYRYKVNYISRAAEENSPLCQTGEVVSKITPSDYDKTNLFCLGQYQWQASACIDSQCQDQGPWSSLWSFTLTPSPGGTAGLVPCGRDNNDPNTSWDEREPCQIKHLFLMIKSILDFLLWRLAPLMLGVLAAVIGAMYYFAFGTPELIAQARSTLRAAGVGYAVLLFGWLLINWVLQIFGISFQWWIINF